MQRKCRHVPLSKKPLVLVLCQVRISPVLEIAKFIPAIQEELRRNGYPECVPGKIQQLNFGPNGIATSEKELWEFLSKDKTWSLLLFQDNFVLQTTAYDSFENFAEKLKSATSTILRKTDHDQFGVIHRIGLRYIDIIQPSAGKDFRDYVRPGFHGVSESIFVDATSRTRVECVGDTEVGDSAGKLVVRVSQDDSGMALPQDLAASAPKHDKRVNPGDVVTFIDIDHYVDGNFDSNPEVVEKKGYLLHDQIIDTFHDHVASPDAIAEWK